MNSVLSASQMTAEEFLLLPEDGQERDLIHGELRERGPMNRRNRDHSRIEATLSYLLQTWLTAQPQSRGAVHAGDVGCILHRDPDTMVGIDVAFFDDSATTSDGPFFEVPPVLAIEILSPSDRHEAVNEKVDVYLSAHVPLIWIVDPHFRTVRVHRQNAEPELFNIRQELSGEPLLPGLHIPVAAIFDEALPH